MHNILVRKLLDYDIPNHILCWIVDFLSDRRQRVKLAEDWFSEWRYIRYKYVDDTTISEVKGQENCIQQMVDDRAIQARWFSVKRKEM